MTERFMNTFCTTIFRLKNLNKNTFYCNIIAKPTSQQLFKPTKPIYLDARSSLNVTRVFIFENKYF